MAPKLAILAALLLVLALPFLVRATSKSQSAANPGIPATAPKLVIITPHVEQIRDEFARGFDRWYFRTHNSHVAIDWRAPGGTSDIMKQLEATMEAAAKNGLVDERGAAKPGAAGCDLFFGGGSYEHGKMKEAKKAIGPAGQTVAYRLGQPANFDPKDLKEWYGDSNKIGTQPLYDPDQYWIGTALSGFGIVFSRDVLAQLGLPEPRSFDDLCDYRMFNMVALADGRQSGSVTTTYESILNKEGWDKGWRTLREMCANARYFASSSTKPPTDVCQGDAAAGLAIDFYGRSEAQMLVKPGMDPKSVRVGYIDPAGAVYIDADPASILNGATNFDLAKSFVQFCLTEEGQALWQFPPISTPAGASNPPGPGDRRMGPDEYALRRMPIRPIMYDKYQKFFVDDANPFKIASDIPGRGWRPAIAPLMAAFGIDTINDLRAAWSALNTARAAAKAGRFPTEKLQQMEQLFYAMPTHTFRDGSLYALPQTLASIDKASRKELQKNKVSTFAALADAIPQATSNKTESTEILNEWRLVLAKRADLETQSSGVRVALSEETYAAIAADTASWNDLDHGKRSLIGYTQFFRENYRRIVDLAHDPNN